MRHIKVAIHFLKPIELSVPMQYDLNWPVQTAI